MKTTMTCTFDGNEVKITDAGVLQFALHMSDILNVHEGYAGMLVNRALLAVQPQKAREYVLEHYFLRRSLMLDTLLTVVSENNANNETKENFDRIVRVVLNKGKNLHAYIESEIDRIFTAAGRSSEI